MASLYTLIHTQVYAEDKANFFAPIPRNKLGGFIARSLSKTKKAHFSQEGDVFHLRIQPYYIQRKYQPQIMAIMIQFR